MELTKNGENLRTSIVDTTTYQKPGIIIIGVQSKTFPKYRKCPTKQPSFVMGNLLYAFSPIQADHLLQTAETIIRSAKRIGAN